MKLSNLKNNIVLAQCNFTVGDIAGNGEKIRQHHAQCSPSELIIFSEMAITGYPPEDLVLRPAFVMEAMEAIHALARVTKDAAAIITGGIWQEDNSLYNTLFFLQNGEIVHIQYKVHLPNYGVFDEKRVFANGRLPNVVNWQGVTLGLLICEDMWKADVAKHLHQQGATLLITINASPFEKGKQQLRLDTAKQRVSETGLPLLYVNQVGAQDELVFDGNSFVLNEAGNVVQQLKGFEEQVSYLKVQSMGNPSLSTPLADIYQAMMLALRDYITKNSFKGVLLGLSGGIDSALVAAVAVDALGAEKVQAVMMPSPYTSQESLQDAASCAALLGIPLQEIDITPAMGAFDTLLIPVFAGRAPDIAEENIQSRIRGNILMAISNKLGLMVLTTGNKSEMAVGYATLYGDMCGGYNVLKDIYKTEVYALADWRNQKNVVIPERILTKAPSAELKPDQTDQDSLPPYSLLDTILEQLIEQQRSVHEIVAMGYEKPVVEKVARLVARAEYKRRQAAPGVKISTMSFGRDRRYPLSCQYTFD